MCDGYTPRSLYIEYTIEYDKCFSDLLAVDVAFLDRGWRGERFSNPLSFPELVIIGSGATQGLLR